MSVAPEELLPARYTHPEEIKAVFDLRIGKHITMQASARVTPAGVVSAGIAVGLMTLAAGYLVGSIARHKRQLRD